MTTLSRLLAFSLLLALASSADAGKFNKKLSVNDAAPSWANLDGTDGKKHSLADLKDKDVVVLFFTCNSCVVATDYEERILAFAKNHPGVAMVAVNVNTGKDDALDKMKARAEKKKFPFVYMYDPSQEIAKAYGAVYTPEFFVLNKDRKVVYLGAMDDKSPPREPTMRHLEEAVKAAASGKPAATGETSASAGCKIKFNVKRDP